MIKTKILISTLLLASSFTASAVEWKGKVSNFYINQSDQVLFKVEGTDGVVPSACQAGLWPFRFFLNNNASKEWVKMLLTTRSDKGEIIVGFTEPTIAGDRCDVVYLYYRD